MTTPDVSEKLNALIASTPRTGSASPERLQHLGTVLRIRLNRIAETSDTNKIWLEARESLEVLRQLEAVMPNAPHERTPDK
jgi:hypothetical protein